MTPNENQVRSFHLRIHPGRHLRGEPVLELSGEGEGWRDHGTVRVPGFDGSATLKLHELWNRAVAGRHERLVDRVVGLETIVKFGSTQQLRDDFSVEIELEFEDESRSS